MFSEPVSRRDLIKYGALLTGGVVIGPTLLSACSSSKDSGSGGGGSGKTVGIYLLAPLTGIEAAWGPQQADAYTSAAKWINDAGGIKSMNGAKLKVTVKDTETTPSVAASAAQQAAGDKNIAVVVGCNQSGASIVVSQVAGQNKIPFVTGTDIDPRITGAGSGWSFQLPPQAHVYSESMLDFLDSEAKKKGITNLKVAILHTNSDLGQACTEAAVPYAKKLGMDLVAVDSYDSTKVSDFTPFLSKYHAAGVQALIGTQDPQPAVLIVRGLKQINWQPEFLGALDGSFGNVAWEQTIGKDSNYTFASQPWSFGVKNLGMEEFVIDFKKKVGREPNDFDQSAFAVISVVVDALERGGSDDRKKLRDALSQTDLQAGKGPIPCLSFNGVKFDDKGVNTRANNFITMSKDKHNTVVFPDSYAVVKPVWPRPPWSQM